MRGVADCGVLQQALRDVSAWAERGVPPPQEANYRVKDGQVVKLTRMMSGASPRHRRLA